MRERGYLIERYINSELRFWNGRATDATGFVPDSNNATRFARAEDGAIVLSWLLGGNGRVACHEWIVNEASAQP